MCYCGVLHIPYGFLSIALLDKYSLDLIENEAPEDLIFLMSFSKKKKIRFIFKAESQFE